MSAFERTIKWLIVSHRNCTSRTLAVKATFAEKLSSVAQEKEDEESESETDVREKHCGFGLR